MIKLTTKKQRALYHELIKLTNIEIFNQRYKELIEKMPQQSRKYYSKLFVFEQSIIEGTPSSVDTNTLHLAFNKAGYKDYEYAYKAMMKINKIIFYKFIR